MDFFSGKEYTGRSFELFGTAHLIGLAVVLLFNISFLVLRRNPESRTNRVVRYGMAGLLIVNELLWHYWNLRNGFWSVQETLPLHLCSLFVFLSAIMLVTKSYKIYEFAYFLGIGGALQPLLTPDAGMWGFPHFRFFQVIISHGLIVSSSIYMTVVQRYHPTWKSFQRMLLGAGVYMLFIFGLNFLIGSNYLFLAHKPTTASLMDMLPPWPWYIPFIILIGLSVFFLLYLPFFLYDIRQHTVLIRQKNEVSS